MNGPLVAIGVVLVSGSLGLVGVTRWRSALPRSSRHTVTVSPMHLASNSFLDDSLASAAELIVSNDPFRLANAPSAVRYDPAREGVQSIGSAPPILVRPSFVLKAIVGGPPWQAVIDGIPGQPAGTIVHTGSAFDKLMVSAITRDSVIIKGPDTTWTVSFRSRP